MSGDVDATKIPRLTIAPITSVNGQPLPDPWDRGYLTGIAQAQRNATNDANRWLAVAFVAGSAFGSIFTAALLWLGGR